MDDMRINDWEKIADGVTRLLAEHKVIEPTAIDLRRFNFWTDFFVVATVTSTAHLEGLERHIEEWAAENQIDILHRRSRRDRSAQKPDDTNLLWEIIDMGNVVIHLMSKEAREFYALEKLWI
jgi:ribosome-associated protein